MKHQGGPTAPDFDASAGRFGSAAVAASTSAAAAARRRGRRSHAYREAHDQYAEIHKLRRKNWLAAHIRERRYELELTQKEVADRADTSDSFISKLERGEHLPTLPVLKRILAVLDEELLIGVERRGGLDEDAEREVAPVPAPSSR